MTQEIFEQFNAKKEQLKALAHKADEYGWLPKDGKKGQDEETVMSCREILQKLDDDKLVIGVIGQMKAGKSTFLNAFAFGDEVLPAATTPMTASLSVITYGEKEEVVAEFYSPAEWKEMEYRAAQEVENEYADDPETLKIKAARELVQKAARLGSSLQSLLGTTRHDKVDQLTEYVGADGKYVAITKAVTLYKDMELLRGVEIVDTPGFNDPVVSREARTREFLSKADAVLLLLYAGRPFDATDREILFKTVGSAGTGRVLVGINKYDTVVRAKYGERMSEEQLIEYVKQEMKNACREEGNNSLNDLLKDTTPIPLAAEMALLTLIPREKALSSEKWKAIYRRYSDEFDTGDFDELRKWSRLDRMATALGDVVNKEKASILFRKPLNSIMAAGQNKLNACIAEMKQAEEAKRNLDLSKDDLEEKKEDLAKAKKKVDRLIGHLSNDINEKIFDQKGKLRKAIEDARDRACNEMKRDIDKFGFLDRLNRNNLYPKLRNQADNAYKNARRSYDEYQFSARKDIRKVVEENLDDISDKLYKYLDDFDARDMIRSLKEKVLFSNECAEKEAQAFSNKKDDFFFITFTSKEEARQAMEQFKREFPVQSLAEDCFSELPKIVDEVRKGIVEEIIDPLGELLQEAIDEFDQREAKKAEAARRLEKAQEQKALVEKQLAEMKKEAAAVSTAALAQD